MLEPFTTEETAQLLRYVHQGQDTARRTIATLTSKRSSAPRRGVLLDKWYRQLAMLNEIERKIGPPPEMPGLHNDRPAGLVGLIRGS